MTYTTVLCTLNDVRDKLNDMLRLGYKFVQLTYTGSHNFPVMLLLSIKDK